MASAVVVAESKDRVRNRAASKPSSQSASRRLLSLDVFRGLTIVAMILVNNPGTTEPDQFWPLQHADWHNPTPTDLIFPTFLFIVGTSLAFSLRRFVDDRPQAGIFKAAPSKQKKPRISPDVYWRIATRTAVLILLGLFLAVSAKLFNYAFGNSSTITLDTLRLPGVLQRIGLVYCATALIVLHIRPRGQVILAATVLLGYWALLAWLPNPHDTQANFSPEGNLVRAVDRAVITDNHLWTQATSEPTDPENLLGTIPSVVTVLFGYWTGLLVQRRGANWNTVLWLMACGAACIAIAVAWSPVLPINKKLWTSSFVFLAGGVSMQGAALCLLVFDVLKWRGFSRPFEIAGINAVFAFVATGLLDRLLLRLPAGDISARQWLYDAGFHSWIIDPKLASLGFALTMVAFWWLVMWTMSRKGWTIRV